MFSRRFPRSASLAGVSQAFILISSLGLTMSFAKVGNGTPKAPERQTEQRPVARLLSTSRTEVPQRVRARLVARMTPQNLEPTYNWGDDVGKEIIS